MVLELILHEVHVGSHVLEEPVIALTQVVESGITVFVPDKPVLGTFSMTGKQESAFPALLRKHLFFHSGELSLSLPVHHLEDGLVMQIAKFVLRKNKVVRNIHRH